MAKQKKIIVTAAVTGGIHTPTMTPYLPKGAEEVTQNALDAAAAGEVCLWECAEMSLTLSLVHRRDRAEDRVVAAVVAAVAEVWGLPGHRR